MAWAILKQTGMENRLKERLTGAAILVALIVALVPEMFRGQRGEIASPSSSSGDGPPVRSYTIDLSNNPKSKAPLQSTADEANRGAVPAAMTPPSPASATPPPAAAASAPTPAPQSAAASADSTKPEPPAHAVRAATAAGGWSVQIGIFAKHDNAERMAHEAQSKGFNVSISNPDASGLFHVRAAGSQDRATAQTLSQKMQAAGIKSAVVPSQ
jgi:cell division septation protein DedD